MKIDRSMFNIPDIEVPPLVIQDSYETLLKAFIEDAKDRIVFFQKDIGVMVSVIELCGRDSATGQRCQHINRINRLYMDDEYIKLKEYEDTLYDYKSKGL